MRTKGLELNPTLFGGQNKNKSLEKHLITPKISGRSIFTQKYKEDNLLYQGVVRDFHIGLFQFRSFNILRTGLPYFNHWTLSPTRP